MASAMADATLLRRARDRRLLTAALLVLVALGCRSESKTKDDDDDDDDDAGVSHSGTRADAAKQSSAGTVAAVSAPASARSAMTWSFDGGSPGSQPRGFSFARTGSGHAGSWIVRAAPDAPSAPNVLAQEDDDRTDYRFPVAVEDSATFGDVSLSVRCKAVSGRVDQACGIVWRYRDENNYYLARANALEDNVNFYYVQDGRRREVKGARLKVISGAWHELRADMRGDHVDVYFDGAKVIDARDSRFTTPGKVGVWTKADSRTLFDDLTATPLGS